MGSQAEELNTDNRKPQNISVSNSLYKKLSHHIHVLKNFENRSISNQSWITNAIKNKIEKNKISFSTEIPKNKIICVKLDQKLLSEIDSQVEFLKKFNISYSKTKLILEAIHDQLESEREKTQQLIEN